jgi:hypothetical protein
MAMSPEAQEEYNRALKVALIRNGSVVQEKPSTYGWADYEATEHLRQCGGWSLRDADEDAWHEFVDSYAGSEVKHGLALEQVRCDCGHLAERTVRWRAELNEVAEAVFEAAFGPKRL